MIGNPFAQKRRDGNVFLYKIDLETGQQAQVFNMHSGFSVGDCVGIAITPTGAFMAYGSGCTQ